MSEDTEKLLKRQISELTSRVDELESIVIDPVLPQPKVESDKPDIQFCLKFEDVIMAFKENKIAARAGWLCDKKPKLFLQMKECSYESVIMKVSGLYLYYNINEEDLYAEDWIVFKDENVFNESVDKNRQKAKEIVQIDVKTGKG